MVNDIHISSKSPSTPHDADFAIQIDFKRGEGDPHRIFKTAHEIISSFQKFDRTLCNSVDVNIQPLMVLEDIEAGSLKIWLKNIITSVVDQALKDLDWKPAIGKYLVRAKYVYINWSNKTDEDSSILTLAKELKTIAQETDVKHLPDYVPPPIQDLVAITKEIDLAKGYLIEGDKLQFLSLEEDPIGFDLAIRWDDLELEDLVVKEVTTTEMTMNLIVKKPDYLGKSKWEFRLGSKPIYAGITDESWLDSFHKREVDIRPGDALKCKVAVEHHYGFDNELVKEVHTIISVDRILQNLGSEQLPLLGNESDKD